MSTSSGYSAADLAADSEPDQKRTRITPVEGGLKPLPPSRYKSVKLTHLPQATYNDMSFEFARLSDGRNFLLSQQVFNVQSDGSIGNALAPFECQKFTRVPGYDFAACSLTNFSIHNKITRLGIIALPNLKAISIIEFRLRSEGRVEFIASDKTSKFGIGRILFCTKNLLFLVDVSKDGSAVITNCVDMSACSALATLKDQKEKYRGLAADLLLYHDPSGNPIAVVSATGGRVVFLSMAKSQCVPFSAYSSVSTSVAAQEGQTVNTFFEVKDDDDVIYPDILPLEKPCGIVLPLRVLHLHYGRPKCQEYQEEASAYTMCFWHPTRGGGSRLLTTGSDGQITVSILDDGVTFSDSCLPYITFPCNSKHLAVHGDVAFIGESSQKRGTFWDLTPEKGPVPILVFEELLRDSTQYWKFDLMSVSFSDDGILAFTNSNDCDRPTLSFLIPTAI